VKEEVAVHEAAAKEERRVPSDTATIGNESHGESAVRTLCGRMNSELPRARDELEEEGRKKSHWVWWAFPTEKKGENEPHPKTFVTSALVPELVKSVPKIWRSVLEKICDLCDVNDGSFDGIIPYNDWGRVKEFVKLFEKAKEIPEWLADRVLPCLKTGAIRLNLMDWEFYRGKGERAELPRDTAKIVPRDKTTPSPTSRISCFWKKIKLPHHEPPRGPVIKARGDPNGEAGPETKAETREKVATSERHSEAAGERWMDSYSWIEQRKFQREATASRIKYREQFPQTLQDSIYAQVKGRKKSSKNRIRN